MNLLSNTIVEIPLEKIRLGKFQARQRDTKVDEDDDIVHGIRKNGLLHPIIVKKLPDGNYDVITGQRRFKAHEILKKSTIQGRVIEKDIDELEAKKLSLNENAGQKKMKEADYIDAVEMFMTKYQKTKIVAEELGLSVQRVRKYIKFSRLPELVQREVKSSRLKINNAIKALDALGGDEMTVNSTILLETAQEIQKLSVPARKKFVEIVKHEPGIKPSDAATKSKDRTKLRSINLEFTSDQFFRINKFKEKQELDQPEDAVSELIDIGLETVENQ